jgi:hypothetical protein
MTGQVWYDSDDDVGLRVAIDLANGLAVEESTNAFADVRVALAIDPSSVKRLRRHHAQAFTALAHRVRHGRRLTWRRHRRCCRRNQRDARGAISPSVPR